MTIWEWGKAFVRRERVTVGLVVALVAGAVLSALLGIGSAAAMFAGVALGLAVLRWLPADIKRAAARPLGDFGRALLPLLLPILVVVLVGTVAYSLWIPLVVVPALIIAGWYLIMAPEWPNATAAVSSALGWIRHAPRRTQGLQGLGLLALVALAAWSWHELTPTLNAFDDRPSVTAYLIMLTLISWVTAVWLRLLGFSTSVVRVPATAIGIAYFLLLLAAAGLLYGYDSLIDTSDGRDPLEWLLEPRQLVIFLGGALAFPVVIGALAETRTRFRSSLQPLPTAGALKEGLADTLRGIGFFFCLFAAAFLAAAAVVSMFEYQRNATESVTEDKAVDSTSVEAAALPSNPHRLALDYMPVLAFTDNERWTPVNVKSFIEDPDCPAELVNLYGGGERQPANGVADQGTGSCEGRHVDDGARLGRPIKRGKLPQGCPGLRVPCYQITIRCPSGDDGCARGSRVADRDDGQVKPPEVPAVYVRTLTRDNSRDSPSAFDFGPFQDLETLVQYWYFYRYDEWTRPVLGGHLVQRHEGDWEAVTIGFTSTEPRFVGYSAHCGGSWRKWNQIELAKTPEVRDVTEEGGSQPVDKPRPLIAVAEGSHANYVKTDDRRPPDPAGCAGIPVGSTTLLAYASNIRDKTEDGLEWRPTRGQTHFVDGKCWRRRVACGPGPHPDLGYPMSFPGAWGGNADTVLINERTQLLGGVGNGPLSPPLQPLWFDPTKSIFCSKNWLKPNGFHENINCSGQAAQPKR